MIYHLHITNGTVFIPIPSTSFNEKHALLAHGFRCYSIILNSSFFGVLYVAWFKRKGIVLYKPGFPGFAGA